MAQCHRVVNGELEGASGRILDIQALHRHFPLDMCASNNFGIMTMLKCSQEVIKAFFKVFTFSVEAL